MGGLIVFDGSENYSGKTLGPKVDPLRAAGVSLEVLCSVALTGFPTSGNLMRGPVLRSGPTT